MHVNILKKKINLLKVCGPQIRLCLLTFRPIASKELNSLTTIVTLSCLGGAEVTHPLWLREVPGSIPSKDFMFDLLFCCCCNFTFLHDCYFSILNILQDLCPIIEYKDTDLASLRTL